MTLSLALGLTGLWVLLGLLCGLLGGVAYARLYRVGWQAWLLLLALAIAGALLPAWPMVWLLGKMAASALALGCAALVTLVLPPWIASRWVLGSPAQQASNEKLAEHCSLKTEGAGNEEA
ncbi:MAG: hypothetical protein IRZ24_13375 [Thermogemmatispora sp.]|uniref:hypothetical protein n=1 Tax=Thermogemmatispora sp. TaxID=1968838 RepID=UPI001D9192FA|nr:hypothetical protein [Thermogemmatispora sp.]MBX5451055.1 hypothetical protein [Thermogemmatispora sp.]